MSGSGNETQVRMVAEQVADAAILRFHQTHPVKAEMPAPVKWSAGILAALFATGITGMCFWVVTGISELQQAVVRMETWQKLTAENADRRAGELERRVATLEAPAPAPRKAARD